MTAASWRCSNVAAFRPPSAEFKKDVGEFVAYPQSDARRPRAAKAVLYPGEIEHMREEDRRRNGIDVRRRDPGSNCALLAETYGLADQARVHTRVGMSASDERLTLYTAGFTSSSSYKPISLSVARAAAVLVQGRSTSKPACRKTPAYLAVNRWGVVPSFAATAG